MANVIITLKIMPESPDSNLDVIEEQAKKIISEFSGEVGKKEIEPVAFGLEALKLIFVIDESKWEEEIESKITALRGVKSVDVVDVRRAVG